MTLRKRDPSNPLSVFGKPLVSIALFFFVALPVSIAAPAPGFSAGPAVAPSPEVQVSVVGHLDLQGMQVKHIFLQRRGDKSYLFLRRADKNVFAIVDVTNPAKPSLVDKAVLREPAGGSVDLPSPGSALAIAFAPDSGSGAADSNPPASASNLPTESVRLVDLTDPQHPKTIKTFNGVTTVATDDGRKLVFLANNEGLWIVSHHRPRPLPMCTSESAIEAVPECQ